MSKNIKTIPTKDFEDVVETVADYVECLRVGNTETLSHAFHRDTVMYGFTNDKLLGGGPDQESLRLCREERNCD
jgi:hypothetical protein